MLELCCCAMDFYFTTLLFCLCLTEIMMMLILILAFQWSDAIQATVGGPIDMTCPPCQLLDAFLTRKGSCCCYCCTSINLCILKVK